MTKAGSEYSSRPSSVAFVVLVGVSSLFMASFSWCDGDRSSTWPAIHCHQSPDLVLPRLVCLFVCSVRAGRRLPGQPAPGAFRKTSTAQNGPGATEPPPPCHLLPTTGKRRPEALAQPLRPCRLLSPSAARTASSFWIAQRGSQNRHKAVLGAAGPEGGRVRREGEAVARQGGTQFPRGLFSPAFAGAVFSLGAVGAVAPFTPLWGAFMPLHLVPVVLVHRPAWLKTG
jgi:hypothetical protein